LFINQYVKRLVTFPPFYKSYSQEPDQPASAGTTGEKLRGRAPGHTTAQAYKGWCQSREEVSCSPTRTYVRHHLLKHTR